MGRQPGAERGAIWRGPGSGRRGRSGAIRVRPESGGIEARTGWSPFAFPPALRNGGVVRGRSRSLLGSDALGRRNRLAPDRRGGALSRAGAHGNANITV